MGQSAVKCLKSVDIHTLQAYSGHMSVMVVQSKLGDRKLHRVSVMPFGHDGAALRFRVANRGRNTESQSIDFHLDYADAVWLRDRLNDVLSTAEHKEAN